MSITSVMNRIRAKKWVVLPGIVISTLVTAAVGAGYLGAWPLSLVLPPALLVLSPALVLSSVAFGVFATVCVVGVVGTIAVRYFRDKREGRVEEVPEMDPESRRPPTLDHHLRQQATQQRSGAFPPRPPETRTTTDDENPQDKLQARKRYSSS